MNGSLKIKGSLPFDKGRTAIAPIAKTEAALIDELKKHDLKGALIALWQINKIVWGKWDGEKLTLLDGSSVDTALLQELRAFTDKAELRLVATGSLLQGRFIADSDNEAEQYEHIDTANRFWGKVTAQTDSSITVTDKERKLTQTLPLPDDLTAPPEYLYLKLRSYISYDKTTAQAGYADYRYLKITGRDEI